MIRYIRAYIRLLCIFAWIAPLFALRLLSLALGPLSTRLEARARIGILKLISRGMLAILGVHVEVRGTIPKAPYVLVSNHLSGLDIFVHSAILAPIFVSQGDVANWPIAGPIARSSGAIFINRRNRRDTLRVTQAILDKMDTGEGVIFYPEATTAPDGIQLPFKSALFEAPVQANIPVHYSSISYATPPGGPSALNVVVWRDPVRFLQHFVNIAALPSCKAIVVFGEEPIEGDDRKVLAEKVSKAVESQRPPLE